MIRKRSDEGHDTGRVRRVASGAAVMQPAVTEALTRALFVEWARSGYGALSLEAVALRARVGKAALYRRWPSKLAFVSDALGRVGVEITPVPDTGSLEGDVMAFLMTLRRLLRHPLVRRIVADLHAEMARSPALAAAVRDHVQTTRRERAAAMLRRSMARGELRPDLDLELAIDLMAAAAYWRIVVTGGSSNRGWVERLAEVTVAALRAA